MTANHRLRSCRAARVINAVVLLASAAATVVRAADPAPNSGPSSKPFVDITDKAGVRHRHEKVVLDKKLERIMPWMASIGACVAACDYNKDGWIDLYVTSSKLGSLNKLYRNNRDGTFTDAAPQAGLADVNRFGASIDAVWGDYDNDGWPDLYLVRWGTNSLFHNNGDNTFTEVTAKTRVGHVGNGSCAIWFDYNDDGLLDLYVCDYFQPVDLFNLKDTRIMHEDFETARNGGPKVLYRNNGDGTFTDVTKEAGVADTGWTLDVAHGDYNNDGYQDLFLANDFGPDKVFRNNGDGTFTEVSDSTIGWDTYKGMNAELGDFNNDGWLDFYVCNIFTKEYVKEGNRLHRNMGDGTFKDISFEAGVFDCGWAWCARFWDYDNDGWLDLMVANGYISGNPKDEYFTKLASAVTKPNFDPIDAMNWPVMGDSTFSGYEPKRLFHNEGNETFKEVAAELGLADTRDGRGLAMFDFDNDGDLDVYMSCQGQESLFWRNDLGNKNHWLEVDLEGKHCNRDAIGARVTLRCGNNKYMREVNGGNGDHSQAPFRQHFGLAQATTIDQLEIRWPNGFVEKHEHLQPNQIIRFVENAPASFLEERKRFKEALIEGRKQELAREKERAEAAAKNPQKEDAIDWNKLGAFKREYLKCKTAVEKEPRNPQTRYDFAMLLDRQDRQTAALGELEKAILLDPTRLLYANSYRALIRRYGAAYYDRAIRFFEDLSDRNPGQLMPALNKALAYVDKMPYPKLGIVAQGKLSNKSIETLDAILKTDPECWAAKFVVAMNHLHWPRKLNHASLAVQQFTELIAMQKKFPPEKQRDHFALAYVGLGDSYVKNIDQGQEENLAHARKTWESGLAQYPNSAALKKRLALIAQSPEAIIQFVVDLRSLKNPVDTDLNLIWVEK
jgi:enediyne biosynthesis protein E4